MRFSSGKASLNAASWAGGRLYAEESGTNSVAVIGTNDNRLALIYRRARAWKHFGDLPRIAESRVTGSTAVMVKANDPTIAQSQALPHLKHPFNHRSWMSLPHKSKITVPGKSEAETEDCGDPKAELCRSTGTVYHRNWIMSAPKSTNRRCGQLIASPKRFHHGKPDRGRAVPPATV
jgi:hypothetical protein